MVSHIIYNAVRELKSTLVALKWRPTNGGLSTSLNLEAYFATNDAHHMWRKTNGAMTWRMAFLNASLSHMIPHNYK